MRKVQSKPSPLGKATWNHYPAEWLEELLKVFIPDADSGVPDADFYNSSLLLDRQINSSLIGELDRVTHKVQNDLLDTTFIAGDRDWTGNVNIQDKPLVLC